MARENVCWQQLTVNQQSCAALFSNLNAAHHPWQTIHAEHPFLLTAASEKPLIKCKSYLALQACH
jgi:hypothetical protein